MTALAIFSPFHSFTLSPLKGVSHFFTFSLFHLFTFKSLFTLSLFHLYIYPNARSTSLRLAITINIIRMEMPAYSARTINFSLGLRLVIIS